MTYLLVTISFVTNYFELRFLLTDNLLASAPGMAQDVKQDLTLLGLTQVSQSALESVGTPAVHHIINVT